MLRMVSSVRSTSRWLVVGWLAVGAVSIALVPLTEEWMVYNNTGVDGGSALWIDVALASVGTWLVAVPLGYMAWRARPVAAKVMWLVAALLVAGICWWFSSVTAMSMA